MGRAREKNVGWRIDYQFITPSLRDAVKACAVHKNPRFSDHAPYVVDYDLRADADAGGKAGKR